MDIIDKIRKVAPTEIDTFHADLERRKSLDDFQINNILTSVFRQISPDELPPELHFRYQNILKSLD